MQRDPSEVGRMKVGAETLAEVLNKLIEPLSYKTMAFGVVLCFLLMGWVSISSSYFIRREPLRSSPRHREIYDDHFHASDCGRYRIIK